MVRPVLIIAALALLVELPGCAAPGKALPVRREPVTSVLIHPVSTTPPASTVIEGPWQRAGARLVTVRAFASEVVSAAEGGLAHVASTSELRVTRGCGLAVSEQVIVTAAHVVDGADCLEVSTADGELIPVAGWRCHDSMDLCVIHLARALPSASQPLVFADVRRGRPVTAMGEDGETRHGVVRRPLVSLESALPGASRDYSLLIETTILLAPGFSGSPLLDEAGRVVGVNVAIARVDGELRGYALPAWVITRWSSANFGPADRGPLAAAESTPARP